MAARPKTLTAALVPIVGATALARALGFDSPIWISFLALMASIFIQVGTNLVNDAVDFKKGADTKTRIGPQRVTQSGLFSYRKVMTAAGLCFFAAVLCGLPLVYLGGVPILIIGIISVIFGWAYTAGPFPLAYLGFGDIFVVLFFGFVAVLGLFFLLTGAVVEPAWILGLQIGLHCTVLIAINNLRDVDGDLKVGKKTLAVRWGKTFARWEIAALCFLPFSLNVYWWTYGFKLAAILPLLALPLAAKISFLVFKTEPCPVYNQFLAKGAGLHLLFGILVSAGLLLH